MSEGWFGNLEEPGPGGVRREDFLPDGRLLVRGWVVDRESGPVEVSARIDGGPRLRMVADGVRDDVFLSHSEVAHAGRCGFIGLLPPPPADERGRDEPGSRLLVEVRRLEGWQPLAEREITARPSPAGEEDDDLVLGPATGVRRPGSTTGSKLLVVSHNFNLEGAPRSLLELGRRLARAGMQLRVIGPAAGPLAAGWTDWVRSVGYVGDLGRIAHLDDYAQRVRRLAALESRAAPDAVVVNTLDAFWGVDLADALGVPSLWIVRESVDVETYFLGRWPYEIARRALGAFERASRVVFVSRATESLFSARVPAAKRRVIWNGLDFGRSDELVERTTRERARRALDLPLEVPIAVCVGTVCQRKGQHVLLEAIARLAARSRAPVCVMVGARRSSYLDGLEQRVRAHGLEGLVRIVPEVDDPYLYYRAADLFVCPSFEESLPRVVLEAMAFALPIVATKVWGIPEMIEAGTGWLVDPGDPVALADAIEAVLADLPAAREAGLRARARARRDFRIETMERGYLEALRELIAPEHRVGASA